jgi:hypothetical protein
MGINIDDLQPLGGSLFSGNENILDNLRELAPEELRISGGGKKSDDDDDGDTTVITVDTGGGCGCGY